MNSSVKFLEATVSVVFPFAAVRWMSLAAAGSSREGGFDSELPPEPPQPATTTASSSGATRASMRPRLSRAPQTASAGTAGLLDETGLLEVALGRLLGLLLVDVDARVELLHHLLGERLLDLLDDLLAVGTDVLERLVADRERDVVGREELLVVVERHVLAAGQVAVGGEAEHHVGVARVEHLVLLLAGHELAELQAVGVFHAEQAVLALLALREAGDREVVLLALEIARRLDAELLRLGLGHGQAERVLERCVGQRGDAVLGEALLGLLVRLLGVLGDVGGLDAEERGQRGAGVLGVRVDVAGLQRLVRDQLGAEVELLLDLEAGGLERLRVDLAQHELLREVLRADGDGRVLGAGDLLDLLARCLARALRAGGGGRRLLVAAARGDHESEAQDGQQGQEGVGSSHDVFMLLFDDRKARRRPPGRPRSESLRPSGLATRCNRTNSPSAAKVTIATTMQAASWPAVP